MRQKIKNLVKKSVYKSCPNFNGRDKDGTFVFIEKPKEDNHGDYSTNIALVLAKKLGKNPLEVAKEIISKIAKTDKALTKEYCK